MNQEDESKSKTKAISPPSIRIQMEEMSPMKEIEEEDNLESNLIYSEISNMNDISELTLLKEIEN
jgi:hypothetical protein